jgi:hypothetical protein
VLSHHNAVSPRKHEPEVLQAFGKFQTGLAQEVRWKAITVSFFNAIDDSRDLCISVNLRLPRQDMSPLLNSSGHCRLPWTRTTMKIFVAIGSLHPLGAEDYF